MSNIDELCARICEELDIVRVYMDTTPSNYWAVKVAEERMNDCIRHAKELMSNGPEDFHLEFVDDLTVARFLVSIQGYYAKILEIENYLDSVKDYKPKRDGRNCHAAGS